MMTDTGTSLNVRHGIALPFFVSNATIVRGETNPSLISIVVTSTIETKRALVGENDNHSNLDKVAQHAVLVSRSFTPI